MRAGVMQPIFSSTPHTSNFSLSHTLMRAIYIMYVLMSQLKSGFIVCLYPWFYYEELIFAQPFSILRPTREPHFDAVMWKTWIIDINAVLTRVQEGGELKAKSWMAFAEWPHVY